MDHKCEEAEKISNSSIPHNFISLKLNNNFENYFVVNLNVKARSAEVTEEVVEKYWYSMRANMKSRRCESESRHKVVAVPPHKVLRGVEDILPVQGAQVMQGSHDDSMAYLQINSERNRNLKGEVTDPNPTRIRNSELKAVKVSVDQSSQ